ncbi:hypothetical protein VNO77_20372 [Canavalia gladiata]|uniref:Uncharacterized protein n=1 Tax=Canavalia gladiata TaxID=3824 RepID=A0AAN9LPG4_CANGL
MDLIPIKTHCPLVQPVLQASILDGNGLQKLMGFIVLKKKTSIDASREFLTHILHLSVSFIQNWELFFWQELDSIYIQEEQASQIFELEPEAVTHMEKPIELSMGPSSHAYRAALYLYRSLEAMNYVHCMKES